ncbi:MAG TPA: hypothetical protein VMS89_03965 [Methanoregulaceae archaeon]|nr:hypothetical protein [Methanoregulaceae archaeon]
MKIYHLIFSLILLTIGIPAAMAAGPADPVSSTDAIYQVHVTSVTLDPVVFFPYETGTITVQLENSGNQTVSLSHPNILDTHFKELNDNSYDTVVHLGPGNTMTYSFLVSPDTLDGTYFPLFNVATQEAGSISYPFKVEVDSKNLTAIIVDKPDNFSEGTKDVVNLSIVNPRNGPVKNIMVTPTGTGVDVIPTQKFISTLDAGASQTVSFQVTPHQGTDLKFHVTYNNGNNDHATDVVLPLNLGVNKVAAVPVINNIALTTQGAGYQLTGDVSNAGITDAMGMVITVVSPARPIEPYGEYAIGSLASDDFSSFTLTFAADDLSAVPVKVTWKDADGNSFSAIKTLDLRSFGYSGTSSGSRSSSSSSTGTSSSGTTAQRNAGGPPGGGSIFGFGGNRGGGFSAFYPVIIGGIVIVAGIVLWLKRKPIMKKLKKQ